NAKAWLGARAVGFGLALVVSMPDGMAHDGHKQHGLKPPDGGAVVREIARPQSPAQRYFTDVELIDQGNRPHRFYSDLLHDKVVVMTAFFTRCKDSCPVATAKILQLQDHLGERLGKDVHFISLTVDPAHDTPGELKTFADKLGANPAWHFLTGKEENIRLAHTRLGTFGPNSATAKQDPEAHGNNIFLGNLRTGLWKKIFGPAISASALAKELDGILADK
ncbi:MAG: SCO family protein, partial [Pseudomonadota bacterium]